MVRAVVFDLDGVLVDSEAAREHATAEYLAEHGVVLDPRTWNAALGQRVADFSATLAGRLGRPPAEVRAELNRRYREIAEDGTGLRPLPFVGESLDRLERAGIRLGLASSGTRRYVDYALGVLGVRARFDAVVTGDDVRRGKPAPDGYLLAAKRLGLSPGDCAAVEDAPNGVAAARAAGMRVVAVPHGVTQDLDFSAADDVANDLRSAVDLLLAGSAKRIAQG